MALARPILASSVQHPKLDEARRPVHRLRFACASPCSLAHLLVQPCGEVKVRTCLSPRSHNPHTHRRLGTSLELNSPSRLEDRETLQGRYCTATFSAGLGASQPVKNLDREGAPAAALIAIRQTLGQGAVPASGIGRAVYCVEGRSVKQWTLPQRP